MLSKNKNKNNVSVLNCSSSIGQAIFEALTKAGITTVWNYRQRIKFLRGSHFRYKIRYSIFNNSN
jgi:hypothetical protein